MKQDVYPELKKIENEIKEIKLILLKSQIVEKKPIKLKGLLKGKTITDSDIEKAKKSLFKV